MSIPEDKISEPTSPITKYHSYLTQSKYENSLGAEKSNSRNLAIYIGFFSSQKINMNALEFWFICVSSVVDIYHERCPFVLKKS